jgi:hypothetical protein
MKTMKSDYSAMPHAGLAQDCAASRDRRTRRAHAGAKVDAGFMSFKGI